MAHGCQASLAGHGRRGGGAQDSGGGVQGGALWGWGAGKLYCVVAGLFEVDLDEGQHGRAYQGRGATHRCSVAGVVLLVFCLLGLQPTHTCSCTSHCPLRPCYARSAQANPDKEEIWLAAFKLEFENDEVGAG